MSMTAQNSTIEAKFCFDKEWSGGYAPDAEGVQGIVDDMIDGISGRGVLTGEGENMVLTITGDFSPQDMERIEIELAQYAMRKEACS